MTNCRRPPSPCRFTSSVESKSEPPRIALPTVPAPTSLGYRFALTVASNYVPTSAPRRSAPCSFWPPLVGMRAGHAANGFDRARRYSGTGAACLFERTNRAWTEEGPKLTSRVTWELSGRSTLPQPVEWTAHSQRARRPYGATRGRGTRHFPQCINCLV